MITKEVPRHTPYKWEGIELWHECKDVDLAIRLSSLKDLGGLRRQKGRALRELYRQTGNGTAPHQVEIFLLEPGTDRYLGRLCYFKACPKKGNRDCRVPGCGKVPFLKQHEDFRWRPETLAPDRSVELYDRTSGRTASAANLPLPGRLTAIG